MNALEATKRITKICDEITALGVAVRNLKYDRDRHHERRTLESMQRNLLKEKDELENKLLSVKL